MMYILIFNKTSIYSKKYDIDDVVEGVKIS